MWLERLTVGPLAENCYLVGAREGSELAIVDPGAESGRIAAAVEVSGRRPVAILLTHGHVDHIAHCAHLAERYELGVWVHRDDLPLLAGPQWPELEAALGARPCPAPAGFLEEGSPARFAGLALDVLHTPGHTPGGICLIDPGSRQALVGDTLFHRGVGRTDLPGGDGPTLARSLRERLFALDGDFLCWPGHGPETRLAEERLENPFVGTRARFSPW
ncbi:MAG: MBL fold metallo-hydrolase [Thermoanaerobaculia bacterium]|nr:MBL fold metallo-hydrolase [Thermoanaerobaculia bacterium]MCZ7651090.1 MBL fold metallo-hydrolase [Thermoanaerobaculia bacterium]